MYYVRSPDKKNSLKTLLMPRSILKRVKKHMKNNNVGNFLLENFV